MKLDQLTLTIAIAVFDGDLAAFLTRIEARLEAIETALTRFEGDGLLIRTDDDTPIQTEVPRG